MQKKFLVAIVDDDQGVRDALQDSLDSHGYESCAFASAEDYLKARNDVEVDCILADVTMSGMSGIELQEVVRASPNPPPVIFVTSHDDARIRERALKGGAKAFLRKPFTLNELIDNVSAVLKAA